MPLSAVSTTRRATLKWWRQAVVYHVFLDRFAGYTHPELANRPMFIGGNLKAIRSRLPYIAQLANVLWISPFARTDQYHAYSVIRDDEVDPHFGTEGDLVDLLGEAHELGMKVICDLVPNHRSRHCPQFVDAGNNPDSQFRHWFNFQHWPDKYERFLTYDDLPKLNLEYEPALSSVRAGAHKLLRCGMDGLRLDHIVGLSNLQAQRLLVPLQQEFPSSVAFGEAYVEGIETSEQISTLRAADEKTIRRWTRFPRSMYRHYQGVLDGTLNFEAAFMLEAYARADDPRIREKLEHRLRIQSRTFRRSFLMPIHLDNHDMDRFLFRVGQDVSRLKAAASLQFSLDQPVVVYYGTEVGMTQDRSMKSAGGDGDLLARQPMIWDESRQNKQLLGFYQELSAARRRRAAKAA